MITTIQVKQTTKARIAKLGDLTTTYDLVLNQILDHIETCKNFGVIKK